MTVCPDCDARLVDALEPRPARAGQDLRLALALAADQETAAIMRAALAGAGLPAGTAEGGVREATGEAVAVLLPADFYRQALGILDADPRLVRGEALAGGAEEEDAAAEPLPLYRRRGAAGAEGLPVQDLDVLRLPVSDLAARGVEVIVPLLEIVRRGDHAARDRALLALQAFGDAGHEALVRLLGVLARENRQAAVFAVVREIRERVLDAALLEPVLSAAEDAALPFEPRCLALHALGRLEVKAVHERIVRLLDDGDSMVRESADEALCVLADEDMGFDADLPAAERRAYMEKWRRWFARQAR
ncbi:MAG: hypothetical protein HY812_02860 [Planctomycetes bacterium]|nr:hypothetical protein [Planctomycetota bacterium]